MPKKASSSHEASQSKVIEPLRNSFSIHSAQLQTASSMPVAGGCMNLFVFFSKPCPQTYQPVRTDPLGPDSSYCLAEVTLSESVRQAISRGGGTATRKSAKEVSPNSEQLEQLGKQAIKVHPGKHGAERHGPNSCSGQAACRSKGCTHEDCFSSC